MRAGFGNVIPSVPYKSLTIKAPSYNLDSVAPNQTFHPSMHVHLGGYSTSHYHDGESTLDSQPCASLHKILPIMNQHCNILVSIFIITRSGSFWMIIPLSATTSIVLGIINLVRRYKNIAHLCIHLLSLAVVLRGSLSLFQPPRA